MAESSSVSRGGKFDTLVKSRLLVLKLLLLFNASLGVYESLISLYWNIKPSFYPFSISSLSELGASLINGTNLRFKTES